jgi:transcriptional regulator with XRE-family HTH domain
MYGYSQKTVARLLGFATTAMVSRWELGIAVPSLVQSYQLARLYQVMPHELYPSIWEQCGNDTDAVPH